MKILSKADKLTQRLINALFKVNIAHSKRDTSIGCFFGHCTWENSCYIFGISFIMEKNLRCICHISFAIIELKQKYSCKRLIGDAIKVDLKSTADIRIASKYPESLIFSVVNLARLESIFSLQDHIHCLSNWSTEEIPFEL